jgi:hypothetical protein
MKMHNVLVVIAAYRQKRCNPLPTNMVEHEVGFFFSYQKIIGVIESPQLMIVSRFLFC